MVGTTQNAMITGTVDKRADVHSVRFQLTNLPFYTHFAAKLHIFFSMETYKFLLITLSPSKLERWNSDQWLCPESQYQYLSLSPGSIQLYGGQSHMRISAGSCISRKRVRNNSPNNPYQALKFVTSLPGL